MHLVHNVRDDNFGLENTDDTIFVCCALMTGLFFDNGQHGHWNLYVKSIQDTRYKIPEFYFGITD